MLILRFNRQQPGKMASDFHLNLPPFLGEYQHYPLSLPNQNQESTITGHSLKSPGGKLLKILVYVGESLAQSNQNLWGGNFLFLSFPGNSNMQLYLGTNSFKCFSNFSMHWNPLEGLLNTDCWAPYPEFLI